nr:DUF6114 domain-containing protein [Nocardiopsis gilva]
MSRSGFRDWRCSRPFWGGALVLAAGVELLVAPAAQSLILPLDLVIYAGIAGIAGYLIGLVLISLGVLVWVQPQHRVFFGVTATLLSLASFLASNFGGFVIGMLLGIVGGAMLIAWDPACGRRARHAAPADDRRDGKADEVRAGDDDGTRGGDLRAMAALPIALALALPGAAPPPKSWPWDWFLPGGGQEEAPSPRPTPAPSSPSPSPAPSLGEGDSPPTGDDGPGEQGPGADDGDDGTNEDADPDKGDGDARNQDAECRIEQGDASIAQSEDEFLEAVGACEAARERGESPDVQVRQGDDRFTAAVAESGLSAERFTMSGARFDGVVEYPTTNGPERYLKISMSRGQLRDGELWALFGEDARKTLTLPSMELSGDVVLHVTRLEARILGIKVVFTPDFPPPLLLPYMVVTDLKVDRPLAQAGTITIDGLRNHFGPNTG